jgi:hypothetical protein
LDQGYGDRNLIAKWKKVCLVFCCFFLWLLLFIIALLVIFVFVWQILGLSFVRKVIGFVACRACNMFPFQ